MTNNKIKIEQALHGYSSGHHLLASSIKNFSEKSNKHMSILSDLSGPEIISGFEEYYTGYPLQNEGMYALSKTWYASEMKRPGCVWTHTLLINYKDLKCGLSLFSLLDYFSRPDGTNLELDKYLIPIFIEQKNEFNLPQISKEKVDLLTWSIMSSERPIIIPANSSKVYQEEILTVIQNQLFLLGHFFTFCTGSLANRTIDKKTFDLQVVPQNIVHNISRNITHPLFFDSIKINFEYPQWVTVLTLEMMQPSKYNFQQFISYFNEDLFFNRKFLGELADLYTKAEIYNKKGSISLFFNYVEKIFSDEIGVRIIKNTINGIFLNKNLHWFKDRSLAITIIQLSKLRDVDFDLSKDMKNVIQIAISNMWDNDRNSVKNIFDALVDGNINNIGEFLVTSIASKVTVSTLPSFSNMDLKTCIVLVSLNNDLALCNKLWKESRNFQLEILSCINSNTMDNLKAKNIIEVIISTTKEVIFKQIFNKFGSLAVSTILSWYYKASKKQTVNSKWLKIGSLHETECMKWIISIWPFDNYNMIYDLVLVLNPYSNEVLQFGKEPWERLFSNIDLFKLDREIRLSLSLFLLPILILTNGKFSKKIAHFIFIIINEKLANQNLDYDMWEKIDKILPKVPWFMAWDKCRRLRMAFEQKGYPSNSFNT